MLFFLCCLGITVILLLYLDALKPKKYPPGPKFLPILGNYREYKKRYEIQKYHHLVWNDLCGQYGNIVGLKLGRNLVVGVFGTEAIQEILTREEFNGRPDGFFFRLRTFGKRLGIVFSDGQFWKKQRKFSLQHLRNFGFGRKEMVEKIYEESQSLIKSLRERCSEPIFMHTAFDVSVLNGLWAMLAGERFEADDARLQKLLKIVHDAFRLVDMSGGLLNQMPFLRFVAPNACGYNQQMDVLRRMWQFLEETIEEHKRTLCTSQPRDLIDSFLQSMNINADVTFTDDQLISLLLDLFMAGSETTSNTLGFAVAYMLMYPEVQKKLQTELDEVVGRNRIPNISDRMRLKYTEAVLMEVQRRANIAPLGIAHRAISNTELFGYNIPKDTIILTNLYSLHMDETFWEDPSAFRPERFLDENGEIIVNEKYYLPFGQGKRRCLGEALGKTNMFLFLTALLHNFYLEPVENFYPSMEGVDGVTIAPRPFKARLIPRND